MVAVYKDEKKKKLKCNIRYNAKAKAGIDMTKIEFDIDEEAKTVKPILPEIQVTAIVDEKSLSFLPEEAKIGLQEALTACEEDAQRAGGGVAKIKGTGRRKSPVNYHSINVSAFKQGRRTVSDYLELGDTAQRRKGFYYASVKKEERLFINSRSYRSCSYCMGSVSIV